MTKSEIIIRIIDRITDPWTDFPEDYKDAELINLDDASEIIRQCREEDGDYDPEDRLPEETTPELMMEAYNCNVRRNRHKLRVRSLAEYITDNEMVCEYSNYYRPTHEVSVEVIPVDFMYNDNIFPFSTNNTNQPDVIDMLRIGMNSAKTFNCNDEYCWFDKDKEILHSTNHPFRDGVLDATAFAEYILSPEGKEILYFIAEDMDEEDVMDIFGQTKEEVLGNE